MKKIIFLTMLLIVTLSVRAYDLCDEDKEYVKIEKETEKIEEERSLHRIDCYIYRSQGVLEVSYEGIGTPYVFLYDSNNNIVDCASGIADCGQLVLSYPSVSGQYMIYVQSPSFKGKGYFIIY